MNNSRPSQCERIIKYLNDYGSITQMEALSEFGIMRLASRISELKKSGYAFEREMCRSINRYGETVRYMRYSLKSVPEARCV